MELCRLVPYLSIVFVLSTNVTLGIQVSINKDLTGFAGSNGTFIECTYDKTGVVRYTYVNIFARQNNTFKQIVEFDPDTHATTIKEDYIKGRVSYEHITQDSNKVMLYFDKLMCIDDTVYYCKVQFKPSNSDDPGYSDSNNTHISVQVLPSKADSISIFDVEKSEQSNATTLPEVNYESNTTMCTSRAYSAQPVPAVANQTVAYDKIFTEGDSININCQGDIGHPAVTLALQMIRKGNEIICLTAVENVKRNMSENCSFYQNNTFTVNLTANDNGASFRCAPESLINDTQIYIETHPISVKYQVRTPEITVYPNQEHATDQKTLTCVSDGNPTPDYAWYKLNDTTNLGQWEQYRSTQNITLSNMTDSGVYRCEANNTIAGTVYKKGLNITITFTGTNEGTSPGTSTYGDSHGHPTKNDNKKKLYYVIGGVAGGLLLIVIVILVGVVKCQRKSDPKETKNDDKSDGPLVHQPSTKQSMGTDNYCSVSLDDNQDDQRSSKEKNCLTHEQTRKHNEKYLREQEEVNVRNDTRGSHQPVEYAMVNKSIKGRSIRQQDPQHQSTEYAQVNKVQKAVSIETQQDEDHYASGQGIYDHANDRRHKKTTESDPYDTPSNTNRRRSDKVGSVVEITGETIKQKQVAKVKPSGRFGYENASIIPDDVIKNKEELNTEL